LSAATARRWAGVLGRPAAASADGGYELRLDNAVARFVALADDRGEGLARVLLSCAEPASMFAATIFCVLKLTTNDCIFPSFFI